MQMKWSEPQIDESHPVRTPTIKNHSVTYFDDHLYCFGGYDGRRNHMTLLIYSILEQVWRLGDASGTPPPGRNGHSATLAKEKIFIIGGWLGTGPLAASDMHVLDLSRRHQLHWFQPFVTGTPPGPCNMHSADYVESRNEVYVFRGGNGREYMNDLHALDVDTYNWRIVETTGETPQQRANHSSAVLNDTNELIIFGGWNGKERLNDIHILDTVNSVWSSPNVGGLKPHPRAGMTITVLRDRLYLFGGSGTSSKCFHDLQILDRKEMAWLDVTSQEEKDDQKSHNGSYERLPLWNSQDMMNELNTIYPTSYRNNYSSDINHNYANPNDEQAVQSIVVNGKGPGRRAGHTATAVGRFIYIFGGSCGSDYLNDFYILDTDIPPVAKVETPSSLHLMQNRLRHFFNDQEFSDVTFIVEGRKIYGHRMVLSLVSDCFRAMFTNGFKESVSGSEIPIPYCSYNAFLAMMEYIYTGETPRITLNSSHTNMNDPDEQDSKQMNSYHKSMNQTIEILELADQFFLDNLKEMCEIILQGAVHTHTCEYLLNVAQKTNAKQLENVCLHFERNLRHNM